MTQQMIKAASESLGYAVDVNRIEQALSSFGMLTRKDIAHRLRTCLRKFDAAGGRGVELADEIDDLRIALAFKKNGEGR